MLRLSLMVCVSTLWLASISCSVHGSKPEPVDLVYSCLKVNSDHGKNDNVDNVPIILLHGLASFKENFHGFYEVLALETGKKVCIVDLRNHGESPWSDVADTVAMTEDVKHLLDKLNAPKAIVYGHSLGGKIAINLALEYPERVEKVISEEMRPNTLSPESLINLVLYANMLKDVNDLIPQGVSEREAKEIFLKNLNEYLVKNNGSISTNDSDSFPIKCKDGKCRWASNPLMYQMLAKDIKSFLIESTGRFDGPALFLYGTESNFNIPGDESNIKELFPNAKLVGIKGAGHMVHTFPECAREVVKFINEK